MGTSLPKPVPEVKQSQVVSDATTRALVQGLLLLSRHPTGVLDALTHDRLASVATDAGGTTAPPDGVNGTRHFRGKMGRVLRCYAIEIDVAGPPVGGPVRPPQLEIDAEREILVATTVTTDPLNARQNRTGATVALGVATKVE